MTDNNELTSREVLNDILDLYERHHPRLAINVYEFGVALRDLIDNAPTITIEDKEKEAYRRGLEVGKRIGARAERTMTIAYLEGKTIEEDQIEQMIKNGEIEAIPYLGETAEEEPKT